MNSTLLCTFHACPMTCQAQECQLLQYVQELERDKARLDWLTEQHVSIQHGMGEHSWWIWERTFHYGDSPRALLDSAMQAMKEGK